MRSGLASQRDAEYAYVLDRLRELRPGLTWGAFSERLREPDPMLRYEELPEDQVWWLDGILDAAGGDPEAAVERILSQDEPGGP